MRGWMRGCQSWSKRSMLRSRNARRLASHCFNIFFIQLSGYKNAAKVSKKIETSKVGRFFFAASVTIRLGATTDEALVAIDSMLDLYDKDVDTTVEFKGRAATSGFQLGDTLTTTCTVVKKTMGGKRLQFLFPSGRRQARCYLSKSMLKELRTNLKIDIKLHPKQHRKQ